MFVPSSIAQPCADAMIVFPHQTPRSAELHEHPLPTRFWSITYPHCLQLTLLALASWIKKKMSYNTIVSCVHHIMTYISFTWNVYIHVDIYLSGEVYPMGCSVGCGLEVGCLSPALNKSIINCSFPDACVYNSHVIRWIRWLYTENTCWMYVNILC